MTKLKSIIGCIFILLSVNCQNSHPFSSTWERPIIDEDINIQGIEKLILNEDSSFSIENNLRFIYGDSALGCTLDFTTYLPGKWHHKNNEIDLKYDLEKFNLNPVPNGFVIKSINTSPELKPDSIKADLLRSLYEYYYAIYDNNPDNVMHLSDVSMTSDSTLHSKCSGMDLNWSLSRK